MDYRFRHLVIALGLTLISGSQSVDAASAIYLGTETGPYKSTDNGATFVPLAAKIGLNVHPFLRGVPHVLGIAIDPASPERVYMIGAFEGGAWGLLKTTDAGETWSAVPLPGVSGARLKIDPIVTSILYLDGGADMTVMRSLDYGETWETISSFPSGPGTKIGDFSLDSRVTRVVYARPSGDVTTEQQVFKSLDYGVTWNLLPPVPGARGGSIFVDPRNTRRLVMTAGDICTTGSGTCGPFTSQDGGLTWKNQELRTVGVGSGQALPLGIGGVVYDPKTDRLYLSIADQGLGHFDLQQRGWERLEAGLE